MSSEGGTELSFDPRTWLSGFDDEPEPAPAKQPARKPPPEIKNKPQTRAWLAIASAVGILFAGAATAYTTRETPPSPAEAPVAQR